MSDFSSDIYVNRHEKEKNPTPQLHSLPIPNKSIVWILNAKYMLVLQVDPVG